VRNGKGFHYDQRSSSGGPDWFGWVVEGLDDGREAPLSDVSLISVSLLAL
jgi:hypothetical protein